MYYAIVHSLDADGDGEVSLEEVEASFSRLGKRVRGLLWRLRAIYNTNTQLATTLIGLIGLTHGGSFAFSVLFASAFRVTAWPLVRDSLSRASGAYTRAKLCLASAQPRMLAPRRGYARSCGI